MNELSFVKKSILLILTNLLTGVLGFIFTIILSRQIGPEGMGLYSLVFPISSLLMSVISGGMMIAVSRVVATLYVKEDYVNLKKSVQSILYFNFFISILLIFLAEFFSKEISLYLIKDLRTLHALRYLLLSIIFMSLSNVYKGYFFGTTNVATPAFIDVFEKLLRIVGLLTFLKLYSVNTIEEAVTIAFLVFCIGEFASLVFFFIYYHLDFLNRTLKHKKSEDRIQLLYNVLVISLPLMVTELIANFLHTISTLLIPRRLVVAGFTQAEALSLIGKVISMSMQIVFFPMIIIFSISTILVPDLSAKLATGDTYFMKRRIQSVLFVSFLVGCFVFLLCFFFGQSIGQFLYKRDDLGQYIVLIAMSAPLIYPQATSRGILNGLGQQKFILKWSTIISIIQVILLYFIIAIPKVHIYGFIITLIVTSFFTLCVSLRKIFQTVKD